MIVTNTIFVLIIVLGISWWATRRLQLIPRGWQLIFEMTLGWLGGFMSDIMGKKSGPRYLPLIASFFLFVLAGNLIGLIPGCTSPTSNINTNLGLALIAFLATFFVGIREIGLKGYLKHKMGPVLAIAPVLFLLETVGEFSRPISLTLRLFGNIMGEDVLIMVLNKLAGMLGYIPMIPVMMAILHPAHHHQPSAGVHLCPFAHHLLCRCHGLGRAREARKARGTCGKRDGTDRTTQYMRLNFEYNQGGIG